MGSQSTTETVIEALGTARDRLEPAVEAVVEAAVEAVHPRPQHRARWPWVAGGAAVALGLVALAAMARRRRYPSDRPVNEPVEPSEAKVKETIETAKEAVTQAVDAAAGANGSRG